MSLRAHGGEHVSAVLRRFTSSEEQNIKIKALRCCFGSPRNWSLKLLAEIVEMRAHFVFFLCLHLGCGTFRASRMLHSLGPLILLGTDRSPISLLPKSSISNEQTWIRNTKTTPHVQAGSRVVASILAVWSRGAQRAPSLVEWIWLTLIETCLAFGSFLFGIAPLSTCFHVNLAHFVLNSVVNGSQLQVVFIAAKFSHVSVWGFGPF